MINSILDKISFRPTSKLIDELDKTDPEYNEKCNKIIIDYVNLVHNVLKNENIEIQVAVLDFFYNYMPSIACLLLSKKDNELFKAQLVLEKLKGIEISDLKNNLEKAHKDFESLILGNREGLNANIKKIQYTKRIYSLLNNYLKDKEIDLIEGEINNKIKELIENINSIDSVFFSSIRRDLIPNRADIIYKIFDYKFITNEELNMLFNNVLTKNSNFESFDFEKIITKRPELLLSVKGLIRKCPDSFFNNIINIAKDDSSYTYIYNFIKQIVELNKDDEEGIKWFIRELNIKIDNNQPFKEFFIKTEIYKTYCNDNNDKIYDFNLKKLLNKDSNIDTTIIRSIGSYQGFKDNYDKLLDNYVKSEDKEYKKKLIIPLVSSLAEREKDRLSLDFRITFTSNDMNNTSLGSYNHADNTLYINPIALLHLDDQDLSLAQAIKTVFHETKHASQFKKLNYSNEIDFNNLIMSMDSILSDSETSGYYYNNYDLLSFEIDAHSYAYEKSKEFFKDYKKMQELIENTENNNRTITYIRKIKIDSKEKYLSILDIFIQTINNTFKLIENDKNKINSLINELRKYPVIEEFFDINGTGINIKNEQYFDKIIEKSTLNKDDSTLLSIKNFMKLKELGTYLQELEDKDYNSEELIEITNSKFKIAK